MATAADYARLHRQITRQLALSGLEPYCPIFAELLISPLRRVFSWAVPSAAALEALACAGRTGGITELGAGTGLWAALLRERGVRVRAYDMAPPFCSAQSPAATNWQHSLPGPDGGWLTVPAFTAIERGEASAVAAHSNSVLLLCWPPCEEDETAPNHVRYMARDAIAAHAGASVALVVDAPWVDDDTTGSRRAVQAAGTHALAALRSGGFSCTKRLSLPSWPGVPAQLQLWARAPHELHDKAGGKLQPTLEPTPPPTVESSDEKGARALRAHLVEDCTRELDELLVPLLLRANGPLRRGERLVLARSRRRRAGGRLGWAERLGLILRAAR